MTLDELKAMMPAGWEVVEHPAYFTVAVIDANGDRRGYGLGKDSRDVRRDAEGARRRLMNALQRVADKRAPRAPE